jgi:thymidine kinase
MRAPQPQLEIVIGPMFSGKTTKLISLLQEDRKRGMKCYATKPALDNRYSQDLQTHDRQAEIFPAVITGTHATRLNHVYEVVDTIGVDEFQFFSKPMELINFCRRLASQSKRVILSGLDIDYRRKRFPWTELFEPQDKIIRLSSICVNCGNPAEYSKRIISARKEQAFVVGGADIYQPFCGKCFDLPLVVYQNE